MAGPVIEHVHVLRCAIDTHHLAARTSLDIEYLLEILWRGQQQLASIRNLAADVIRQPTIGERNVLPLFEDDNLGRFIQPPGPPTITILLTITTPSRHTASL
jgi:hypothetical protein